MRDDLQAFHRRSRRGLPRAKAQTPQATRTADKQSDWPLQARASNCVGMCRKRNSDPYTWEACFCCLSDFAQTGVTIIPYSSPLSTTRIRIPTSFHLEQLGLPLCLMNPSRFVYDVLFILEATPSHLSVVQLPSCPPTWTLEDKFPLNRTLWFHVGSRVMFCSLFLVVPRD